MLRFDTNGRCGFVGVKDGKYGQNVLEDLSGGLGSNNM